MSIPVPIDPLGALDVVQFPPLPEGWTEVEWVTVPAGSGIFYSAGTQNLPTQDETLRVRITVLPPTLSTSGTGLYTVSFGYKTELYTAMVIGGNMLRWKINNSNPKDIIPPIAGHNLGLEINGDRWRALIDGVVEGEGQLSFQAGAKSTRSFEVQRLPGCNYRLYKSYYKSGELLLAAIPCKNLLGAEALYMLPEKKIVIL